MNENSCNVNNKKENFDLKEIIQKNKDLSKIFQQQSHSITQKTNITAFVVLINITYFCILYML